MGLTNLRFRDTSPARASLRPECESYFTHLWGDWMKQRILHFMEHFISVKLNLSRGIMLHNVLVVCVFFILSKAFLFFIGGVPNLEM